MNTRRIFYMFGIVFLCLFSSSAAQFTTEEMAQRENWEDFLRTAEIIKEEKNEDRRIIDAYWRLTLEKDGINRMVLWKNPEGRIYGFLEGWKWEIAAYRLDKYLDLNMVPPTVEREFHGERGSCQLWETAEMDMYTKLKEEIEIPQDRMDSWNKAIYLQRAFDNLIANYDRNQFYTLITKDWRIILIDHSRSFGTTNRYTTELIYTEKHRDGPKVMEQLPRIFVEKIRALNFELLREIVEEYLTDEEIEAVLLRRDLILKEIERLIGERGEDKVLY